MEMVALTSIYYLETGRGRCLSPGVLGHETGLGQVGTLCAPHLSRPPLASPLPPLPLLLERARGELPLTQASCGEWGGRGCLHSPASTCSNPQTHIPGQPDPAPLCCFQSFQNFPSFPSSQFEAYPIFQAQANLHLLQEVFPALVFLDLSGLIPTALPTGSCPARSLPEVDRSGCTVQLGFTAEQRDLGQVNVPASVSYSVK